MQEVVTYDLSDMMASGELKRVIDLLTALYEQGYPEKAFSSEGLKLAFNRNSGFVWLESDEFDCAMMNTEGRLELFLNLPHTGIEDFVSELVKQSSGEWHVEDLKQLLLYLDKGTKAHDKVMGLLGVNL